MNQDMRASHLIKEFQVMIVKLHFSSYSGDEA